MKKTKAYLYYINYNPIKLFGIATRYVYYRFLIKGKGLLVIEENVKFRRTKNIKMGKNVFIGSGSKIYSMPQGIRIGNNVTIKENCHLDVYNFRNESSHIKIGNDVVIGLGSFINGTGGVIIGNNVLIGPRLTIISQNHNFKDKKELIRKQGITCNQIHIDDDVWIGANVTILDGVYIGKGAVIGANALITKDVKPNSVMIGVNKLLRRR